MRKTKYTGYIYSKFGPPIIVTIPKSNTLIVWFLPRSPKLIYANSMAITTVNFVTTLLLRTTITLIIPD
jgi:hypothetical protein